ncbi:hypothetical protein ACRAWD_01455 [Caulobacter segnis]
MALYRAKADGRGAFRLLRAEPWTQQRPGPPARTGAGPAPALRRTVSSSCSTSRSITWTTSG